MTMHYTNRRLLYFTLLYFTLLYFGCGRWLIVAQRLLILVPVPPFQTHLFLHPSLLPLLIHHSTPPLLPLSLSFTPGLKLTRFTNPTPCSFISFPSDCGLPSQTITRAVSSELPGFLFCCFFLICFVFGAVR